MAERGLYLGLMSGTSADGVDACLVQLAGHGFDMRFRVLGHRSDSHPRSLRESIHEVSAPGVKDFDVVDRLLELDVQLGHAFAGAAMRVVAEAGAQLENLTAVGLHGQTVRHRPPRRGQAEWKQGATRQIGCPAVVAETLGVKVVHDFRRRDMVCGGQGAPLVPFVDLHLLGGRPEAALALNLGGIANLTWVPPAGREPELLAFDVGPANSLMDAACRLSGKVRAGYDRGGRLAAAGVVDQPLLAQLMAHPFFSEQPPRSTGPEDFGEAMVLPLLAGRSLEDLLATLAAFTVESVGREVDRLAERGPLDRVLVSGGGVENPHLLQRLEQRLEGLTWQRAEELGIPHEAKEAFCFAVLAHQTVNGRPGNLPSATGAREARVLGSVVPA